MSIRKYFIILFIILCIAFSYSRIFAALPQQKAITLTAEEKAWLKEHPVIKVASDAGWAPVEYVDKKGDFQGISIAYLRMIEGMLGVKFDFYTSSPGKT